MQRPSYALALLLASLAGCMVIANVAQCQVIVVFHDVSEGTDEPAATVIGPDSTTPAAEVSDEANADLGSDEVAPAQDPIADIDELFREETITSEEPAVPGESPVRTEIDAGIAGDDLVDQPYDLPDHSRVCPYSGDWLDFGARSDLDQVMNDSLRFFSTDPSANASSADEQVADIPAPGADETPLQSAEIFALEEDASSNARGEYAVEVGSPTPAESRDAALRLAATFDRIGNWFHQASADIRDWANETSGEDVDSAGESVESDFTDVSDELPYDESADMIEQLE